MKKTKAVLFLVLIITSFTLQAQTSFLKGYYVTTGKDTVRGYIGYRSKARLNRSFAFKATPDANDVTLYPGTITAFSIQNKDFFETHAYQGKKGEKLYAFFRVLIRGRLTLLFYSGRYFVKDTGGEVKEITKKTVKVGSALKTDFTGMGELVTLTRDCAEMTGSFLEREYKKQRPSYETLIRQYNQCMGSPYTESENIRIPLHVDPTAQASFTATTLHFKNLLKNATFSNHYSASLGLGVSIFIPKAPDKMRLVVEANYNRFSKSVFFKGPDSDNDLLVQYRCLKVPLIFRYDFGRVFVDLGFNNQFILDQKLRWQITTYFDNAVQTKDGPVTALQTWGRGMVAGVGARFNVSGCPSRLSLRFSQNPIEQDVTTQPIFRSAELNFSFMLVNPR